ncbi:NAD(P)-binding protein [Lophiostoma macrostomum CBS 122681]|uniref:NAD(P)-binding protein n=1 Tax=Lophiostoma macrostomum CBS 122681 TaxID=1314788 RepID=A0A6A6T8P4_9PLEO|nr:NAD(P)-binding protein [Lophiostoma macrostomum CBS 122681]
MPQLTWLITGCSSGFGETLARSILARGDKAIATARGPEIRLGALVEAGAKTYSLDVTGSQKSTTALFEQIVEENGAIDVLVNNAGYIHGGIAEELSIKDYVAQFETNFFGTVKCTHAILPHFRARKAGTIVFMGSMGGITGAVGAGPYCASKFALEGFYECLKQEIAHLNIQTLIFEPGLHRSKIMHPENLRFKKSGDVGDYDALRDGVAEYLENINGKQPGDPEKAVRIIIDVVKGEGVAEGKEKPERLPIGEDALDDMTKKYTAGLKICQDWEATIGHTEFDE